MFECLVHAGEPLQVGFFIPVVSEDLKVGRIELHRVAGERRFLLFLQVFLFNIFILLFFLFDTLTESHFGMRKARYVDLYDNENEQKEENVDKEINRTSDLKRRVD